MDLRKQNCWATHCDPRRIPGGSAQMADRLKEAEKAWGGLWAVEAKDLPEFENQPTEDEIRRV
eukprot:116072-Heterocapsa_arctica.AAC.1